MVQPPKPSAWLLLALGAMLLTTACAGQTTPIVAFKTATPLPSPTARPSATPRPIMTLAPTATAGVATPTSTGVATPVPFKTPTPLIPVPTPEFSGENAYRHVEELSITIGVRSAGTEKEREAADYVADQLSALGYSVGRQSFEVTLFQDTGSSLTIDMEPRQVPALTMYYSGVGQVSGQLVTANLGTPADFGAAGISGKIALIERGELSFAQKARNARAAGAVGVIIYNHMEEPTQVRGSLQEPFDLPVVWISRSDGLRLRRQMVQRIIRATLRVSAVTEKKPSVNVVTTSRAATGDQPIIIIGAHLDTAVGSPGANNNATGVGVMLEVARVLARDTRADYRFVAFGGSEVGLLGGTAFLERLTTSERRRVAAVVNLNMLGVGTGTAFAGSEELVAKAMVVAERLKVTRLTRLGANARTSAGDHVPFANAGLPTLYIHRPEDPNWNTSQDRAQFVKIESLLSAGQVCLGVLDGLLPQERPATGG